MGIFSLLIVVVAMWIGVAAFFIFLARRSAAIKARDAMANSSPEPTTPVR